MNRHLPALVLSFSLCGMLGGPVLAAAQDAPPQQEEPGPAAPEQQPPAPPLPDPAPEPQGEPQPPQAAEQTTPEPETEKEAKKRERAETRKRKEEERNERRAQRASEEKGGESKSATRAPGSLVKIQSRLRAGPIGKDPAAVRYLDLVDRDEASPMDLNAFGNFLARRGYLEDALEYYKVGLHRDRANPTLWLNTGTVKRQLGHLSAALVAYKRALKYDPNDAFVHYNIGVVHDFMHNYDRAVEEYTRALALDPSLGEPSKNPQVVNNDRLLVVNLLLYQSRAGALGLPLMPPPEEVRPIGGSDIRRAANLDGKARRR